MGSRFVSEFGMEAYPHLSTITSAITDPKQQYPGSMYMDYHNRALDHERRVLTYVGENFQIKYDLPSFTHLTQVTQADVMDTAYRFWRRDWGKPGSRKSGGVLVWQLNDCWPTMSWALVDYHLVKKPSFYAIKRALKPTVVGVSRAFHEWTGSHVDPTIAARDTKYDVWVASSRTLSVQGDVTIRFVSIKTGEEVAPSLKKSVVVQANCTTDIIQQRDVDVAVDSDSTVPFDKGNYDPYVICTALSINGTVVSTHTAWPQPIKYLDLGDRGVKVEVSEAKDKIIVSADKPVHGFVFEERKNWIKFSDNGFDIIPGESTIVDISGANLDKGYLKWTYIGADI
jgi:beta-mannosidase